MPKRLSPEVLDERAQSLLKVLIERFIADGQPVGSRTLAKAVAQSMGNTLSPATIRNVMSDLEEQGFVASPHTSAGRIPTSRGYRLFVDSLLTVSPLENNRLQEFQHDISTQAVNRSQLIQSASDLISEVTHMAGVVTLPRRERVILRHIEFLPLADNRVLVVLVINADEVQNRIIQLDQALDVAKLQQAANYLNNRYAGLDLIQIRQQLLDDMQRARQSMDSMMSAAVTLADDALGQAQNEHNPDFVLTGQTNLMRFEELCDLQRLRGLFESFGEKQELLGLLDKCLASDGVHIFIGEESGYQALDECSVVTAPYEAEGQVLGVLAVIGPTRMAYDRVIPIVDATARILGTALSR